MRIGGASTSGWASHKRIMADHVRAYRENHVHSKRSTGQFAVCV